jgi:hypothetical protein
VAARTHLVLAAAVGGWTEGESPLAMTLLPAIRAKWLVLMDRGFWNYQLLWGLRQRSAQVLIRGRRRIRLLKRERLGQGDWIVHFPMPLHLRRLRDVLPAYQVLRLVHYRIPGFRPSFLVTSLLDPRTYPATDLVALYHERWEQELAFDEMKTHLASSPVTFRSQTPARVRQEIYGLLLAYNLVRGLMAEAAKRHGCSPLRLSFVGALDRVERATLQMALLPTSLLPRIYEELLADLSEALLPARRPRRNPRVVKVKMSSFPLKRGKRVA